MTLITLDPTGVRDVELHSIAARVSGLRGKRVGLLYNVKRAPAGFSTSERLVRGLPVSP